MSSRIRSAAAAALALAFAGAAGASPAADSVALRGAPAAVGGLWCGAGLLREFTLEVAQQYQDFQARLIRKNRIRQITGRVEGTRVHTDPQRNETMDLLVDGDQLRIVGATGVLSLAKGQFFTRAVGASCTR